MQVEEGEHAGATCGFEVCKARARHSESIDLISVPRVLRALQWQADRPDDQTQASQKLALLQKHYNELRHSAGVVVEPVEHKDAAGNDAPVDGHDTNDGDAQGCKEDTLQVFINGQPLDICDVHSAGKLAAACAHAIAHYWNAEVTNIFKENVQKRRERDPAAVPTLDRVQEEAKQPRTTILGKFLHALSPAAAESPAGQLKTLFSEAVIMKAHRPNIITDVHEAFGRLLERGPRGLHAQVYRLGACTAHSTEESKRRSTLEATHDDHGMHGWCGVNDQVTTILDNAQEQDGHGKYKNLTTAVARKLTDEEMADVPLHLADGSVFHIPRSGIANLKKVAGNYPPWAEGLATEFAGSFQSVRGGHGTKSDGSFYSTGVGAHVDGSFHLAAAPWQGASVEADELARRKSRQDSFFGRQEIEDIMLPEDLVPSMPDNDFGVLRLLFLFESCLATFQKHGYGILPGDMRAAKSVRQRKRARRALLAGMLVEQGDERDVLLQWDVGWNKLRANNARMFKEFDLNFAIADNLAKLEQLCIDCFEASACDARTHARTHAHTTRARAHARIHRNPWQVGTSNNIRETLFMWGDGAPVRTRGTNPDGSQQDRRVLWLLGQWHKVAIAYTPAFGCACMHVLCM